MVPVVNSGSVQVEQLAQRRQRPGADDVRSRMTGDDLLDPGNVDPGGCPGQAGRLEEERAFARVALDEIDLKAVRSRPAMARIRPGMPAPEPRSSQSGRLGREIEELERVGDVAGPDLGQRRRADQVLDGLPAAQLLDVEIEGCCCFT